MLLSSLSSMSLMSDFRSKLLKILDNIEDNPECPQMTSMSSKEGNQTDIEDIRTIDDWDMPPHSEACDCSECCPEERDGELGLSRDNQKTDSEIGRISSNAGEEVHEVTLAGDDGKLISRIINSTSPEFDYIRRQHEQQKSR